jgi:hypothetical protein
MLSPLDGTTAVYMRNMAFTYISYYLPREPVMLP